MLRQYHTQTVQGGINPHRVGTLNLGEVVYVQDHNTRTVGPTLRDPWQVVAFLNREYHPCVTGAPRSTYMTGGHLTLVRSLRDGREQLVAEQYIKSAVDNGWTKGEARPMPLPFPTGYAVPLPRIRAKVRKNVRKLVA